jgi:hypothetical protein
MQWVQNPIQSNVCNLNNVRHKAGRLFKSKEKTYWKFKFDELETNSTLKNIRDMCKCINDFRIG